MATGIFKIHPKNGPTITIDYPGQGAGPYFFILADFNEGKRQEVIYSSGKVGGVVQGVNSGLVEIEVVIQVAGNSEAECSSLVRPLMYALGDKDGGTIEYKPVEYADNVLHTYYTYLQAPPPTIYAAKTTVSDSDYKLGVAYQFKIKTKAWATSDPANPVAITSGSISDANSNSVTVLSSALKGDITFPNFTITPTLDLPSGQHAKAVLFYTRESDGAANREVMDGTDFTGPNSSDGSNYKLITDDTILTAPITSGLNKLYFGWVTPILDISRNSAGSPGQTVEVRVGIQSDSMTDVIEWSSPIKIVIPGDADKKVYFIPEIPFPPIYLGSDLYISGILDALNIKVQFTLGNSDPIRWYFMGLLKADEYITMIKDHPSGPGLISPNHIKVSSHDESVNCFNTDDAIISPWHISGTPLSEFIISSNRSTSLKFYRLRITNEEYLLMGSGSIFGVVVTGVFGTIYPFDEA